MQWWHRNTVNTSWAETVQREWTDCWTDKCTQAVSSFLHQGHDLFCRCRTSFSSETLLLADHICPVRRKSIEVLTSPSLLVLFFSQWKCFTWCSVPLFLQFSKIQINFALKKPSKYQEYPYSGKKMKHKTVMWLAWGHGENLERRQDLKCDLWLRRLVTD